MTQVRTLVCLIPHPERPAILSRPDGGLPTTTIAGDFELPAALAAMEAMLGRCPPLLRLEQLTSDDQGEPILLAMDLEAWTGRPPLGLTWTSWTDARVSGGALPEVAATLPRWIARREHGPMPSDPPWSVPGWSDAATAWMLQRMAEAGLPATDVPRLHYGWGISVVWRTPTSDGPCYLKCSTPIFGREAALTARIAQRDPALTTRVLAVDEERNLLLMRDHGDRALASEPADAWVVGLEGLATIQRGWTTATDELAGAGAPIRTLADLATDLLTMADREPLRSELIGPDRVAWDAAVPAFVDACRRLDAIGPASTLGHGDFHPWNVVVTDGGPVIFDWTDAAVTHPFLDLAVFVTRADDPAVRRRLRDAYLARWADVLNPADLAEAGDLAILVGTLYQVESYVRLLSSLEPEDQGGMRGAAGSWARAAIDVLATGIDTRRPGHADG